MKKLCILFILTSHLLWSATAEQIEHYLSVSTSEEELLLLESQFSAMQNGFSEDENGQKDTYDMQLLTVRFKDYLQRHLSDNEMTEVLENYTNVLFLQFVSTTMHTPDKNETEVYIQSLENDPDTKTRLELLESISKALNNKESMIVMFDELMKPLLQNSKGGKKLDDTLMQKQKDSYMKSKINTARRETLFNLKEFTVEELEELLTVVKSSSVQHEVKAVYGATAYALKEFFLSMASRYDISKHQPRQTPKATPEQTNKESNTSK